MAFAQLNGLRHIWDYHAKTNMDTTKWNYMITAKQSFARHVTHKLLGSSISKSSKQMRALSLLTCPHGSAPLCGAPFSAPVPLQHILT